MTQAQEPNIPRHQKSLPALSLPFSLSDKTAHEQYVKQSSHKQPDRQFDFSTCLTERVIDIRRVGA